MHIRRISGGFWSYLLPRKRFFRQALPLSLRASERNEEAQDGKRQCQRMRSGTLGLLTGEEGVDCNV